MAYRREDIDRVRDATDLVELFTEVTKVKRSGRSVMAVCPFHQEKTPSMSVDPARGLYHCFGCEASGDVFKFVQETQSVDFTESVELLARRAGITLQEDPGAARRRDRKEELLAAVEEAVDYYHSTLRSGEEAGPARAYLRARGYDSAIVEHFLLGYSPDRWDGLTRHLTGKGVKEATLLGAGLAVRSRVGRLVDRFRGRVMFPIYDVRGDAVGFGARLLAGEGPKYLNSPETSLYHKSSLLYGLNWAKSTIVREQRAVVVEGYTDVIAFHQAGRPIAVATCGTALGEGHLDLLRRFTERVVLAFDADAAGTGASLRGFEQSVPGDLDMRMARLPEGKDPADLVAGAEERAMIAAVEESAPLLQFTIERELERFDLTEAEARGRAIRAAAGLITRHPDSVVRHEYAVMLSRRTGVDLDVVNAAVVEAGRAAERTPRSAAVATKPLSGQEKAERELLRLLLANVPGLRGEELDPDLFTRDDHRQAYELLEPAITALPPGEPPDLGSLLGSDESDLGRLLRSLAMSDRPLAEADETVKRLKVGGLERRIDKIRRRLERMNPENEPEDYSTLFGELIGLESRRRELRVRE
jgi:DNA primase